MTTATQSDRSPDLLELGARFETFRATRQHGTRIPPELYRAAIDLLDRYPEHQICRELQLDPGRLRRRQAALSQGRKPKRPRPSRTRTRPAPLSFVEVPLTTPAPASRSAGSDVRLQLERADGLRLTISVEAIEWARVEALARQLFVSLR
jgi:hypothetical protein